jgi:MerR family transcriptional regulator, light-induced transcriptional regulator
MFAGQQDHAFPQDTLDGSTLANRKPRSKLPEDSVVTLAKEVLLRLTSRRLTDNRTLPSDEQIDQLCHALMSPDDEEGLRFVAAVRASGASIEAVYADYLSAAAERLGLWWNEGQLSFVDVTIGTSRIYAILRVISQTWAPSQAMTRKSAAFAAVPGETHTLGVRMAADLCRRAGWDIDLLVGMTEAELVLAVERSDHRLIGLSSGGKHSLKSLGSLVTALRKSRIKPYILVCGQVINEPAEVIRSIGADCVVCDLASALAEMDRVWEMFEQAQGLPASA